MKLLVPTRSPPEMGAAAHCAQAAFTVASSALKGTCSHLPMRTALSVSAWLETCPASPPSVLQAPARPPHSRIAVRVSQGDATSTASGTPMGPCSVGVVTTVPPVSARTGRWNVPSGHVQTWPVPERNGGWALDSAASPAGSPRPSQAALSMTTGLSFRLDRSGRLVTPVSYASAR